ncbi:hypothetical protein PBRA_007659 [Plasmodiophora brassicae]|uniref:DDE Tnp4 domain-containing protein n=1 Tax=Plasmodiophora brassicae TaxID=37360 RepID=A0A0G4IX64_PLABS|nr:hypothetical protein PBRA_007659 [Plasmodiophora brassicae]
MLAREFRTASSTVLRRYHDRRFRALFGVSVDICVALWLHIQSHIVGNAIRPKHLLWALHFMKENPTEISGSSKWGVDPGTWSQHVQRVLRLLHRWLPALPWSLRNTGAINGVLTGIVDVTRVKIEKPALHPWEYYSKYDNFHALKFEVVVSAMKPHLIIWVSGPWKGAVSDITIARELLIPSLGEGERLMGDKGYAGEPAKIITPISGRDLTRDDRAFNRRHNSVRQVVERALQRVKRWKCLSETWRRDLGECEVAFHVICGITNFQFVRGEPLTVD